MNELVSVIMSTYNETLEMLDKSIQSILNQSYKHIQLIIINDNPKRNDLHLYLTKLSNNYSNIVYIKNKNNIGLVMSLNKALKYSDGYYIARMDADDISYENRIEEQLKFLIDNSCDIVGTNVLLIDENDREIGTIKVPTDHKSIKTYHIYGSCMLHPSWLGKKSVFKILNGYRNIYACEDYDFILRAINNGFITGNVPNILLKYRIRSTSISISSEARQKLTMYYIIKNKKLFNILTLKDFDKYFNSNTYLSDLKKLEKYILIKNEIKYKKFKKLYLVFELLFNKYLYINLFLFLIRKYRNFFTD